jgi:hypothetical protein
MRTRTFFSTLALTGLVGGVACGNVVTFRFDGAVDSNTITAGEWAFAHAGDSFAVQFSFESTTPDSDPDMGVGNYGASVTSFAIFAGSGFETGAGGGIIVTNSDAGDDYRADLSLMNGLVGSIHLQDATGAVLADDHLPTGLNFDAWLGRTFTIAPSGGAGDSLTGTITSFSVVPAPGVAAMGGLALIGTLRRRR